MGINFDIELRMKDGVSIQFREVSYFRYSNDKGTLKVKCSELPPVNLANVRQDVLALYRQPTTYRIDASKIVTFSVIPLLPT